MAEPNRSGQELLSRNLQRLQDQYIGKIQTAFYGILKAFDKDTGRCVVTPKDRYIHMPHQWEAEKQDIGLVEGTYVAPVSWYRQGQGGWRIIPMPGDQVVCIVIRTPQEKQLTNPGDKWTTRIDGTDSYTGLPKLSDTATVLPRIKGRTNIHDCIVMPFGVRTKDDPIWFGQDLDDNPISFGSITMDGTRFLGYLTWNKLGGCTILSPEGVSHRIQSEGSVDLSAPVVTCNGNILCTRPAAASLPQYDVKPLMDDMGGTIQDFLDTILPGIELPSPADLLGLLGLPTTIDELLDSVGLPDLTGIPSMLLGKMKDVLNVPLKDVMTAVGADKVSDLAADLGVPVDEVLDQTVGDVLNNQGIDTEGFLDNLDVSLDAEVGGVNVGDALDAVGLDASTVFDGLANLLGFGGD